MRFIDTHAHIYVEQMLEDKEEILARAVDTGVSKILMPNIDKTTISPMLSLYKEYPNLCLPMLGLHPVDVKEDYNEELEEIFSQFSSDYVGIGEIGLDLYWDKTTLPRQIEALKFQLDFAIEKDLPVSVHIREAFPQGIEVFEDYKDTELKGVLHCFTGGIKEADRLIELGFYLGIGGVLTFKNAGVDKTIAQIGMKHLILETDSPYLAPTPFRGKQNEPSYLIKVAEKLAAIKECSMEEVAKQTTENAQKLFNL